MAKKSCRINSFFFVLAFLAVIFCFMGYTIITIDSLPDLNVYLGDPVKPDILSGNKLLNSLHCDIKSTDAKGSYSLQYKFAGFPIKKLAINAIPPIKVIPGGQSIGIIMRSKGVMVVGISKITDQNGETQNPAEDAGIKIGDLIISVNGKKITSEFQLKNEIANSGINNGVVELEIKRGPKVFTAKIKTVQCKETGRPRLGLFVRDTASGVGTISFYHPETKTYGALGHMITDVDTAMGIHVSEGKITEATITGIHRGKKGRPGEKIGMFLDGSSLDGNIEKNTNYGIFGKLTVPLDNPYYQNPIPVALSYQIKKGPAQMLTVIDGTEIRKYSVEIQEIFYPWNHHGKGMIIKITDPELIKNTGGIIQGMSGSPIMQDGMLIGTLTHVFINDPLRGYGVPAEWMLKEAGILNNDKKLQNAS